MDVAWGIALNGPRSGSPSSVFKGLFAVEHCPVRPSRDRSPGLVLLNEAENVEAPRRIETSDVLAFAQFEMRLCARI
jgi:hypothetical protein